MDFALPAMFAGLLVLQILSKTNKALEISIAIFTIFCLIAVNFLMPGMWAVMVTTIIASTVGMVIKKWN